MKTLSGVRIAALVGLGVAMALTLRALAQNPQPTRDSEINRFVLKIKKNGDENHRLKPRPNHDEEDVFKQLVCNGNYDKDSDGKKQMRLRSEHGKPDIVLPRDCPPSGSQLSIKTDRVTVSNKAQSFADDELTVIGAHVTIQLPAISTDDVKKVLDLLEPTP